MKKIIFTMLLAGCCIAVFGQQKTEDDYWNAFQEHGNAIGRCLNAKDYAGVEKEAQAVIDVFDALSDTDRSEVRAAHAMAILYNLSRAYALSGQPKKAIETLTKAIDNGYTNYYHASRDTDFDSLRDNPAFIEQLERIAEFDYLKVLKSARAYRTGRPAFEYQPPQTEELAALRREFNLDSIAGNGTELSQIKNLMTWLHDTVRHDGGNPTDTIRTASALIAYAARTGRGVNCRMLAISLHEIYLAMGFPSRYVTCLPKSDTDPDCHVINVVWSRTMGKWLWMDPSFNQWVTDDCGMLLSIEEVRERAVAGQPLMVNPDGNWNNQNPSTKESYLDGYMFKNLYWLQCPAWTGYGTEARFEGRPYPTYVALCPPGFYGFNTGGSNHYVTNNPAYFWQNPE